MDTVENHQNPFAGFLAFDPINTLLEELGAGLADYWKIAGDLLRNCGIEPKAPRENDLSLEKNFFSMLFLYSFFRAGIAKPRRIFYGATLQCLRGMVTGCDNLLDDEYKKTLDTDIPETAFRFRSVMDIMISDRVLFCLLTELCRTGEIDLDAVTAATASSMKTMTRSGLQEASEEGGITTVLKPDDLLQKVHHYKTGILFQCPWDIPLAMEKIKPFDIAPLLEGLYSIGMGCQVMDDKVDLLSDLKKKRHNYLVSLIHHGPHPVEKKRLQELFDLKGRHPLQANPEKTFPKAMTAASETSHKFLEKGLNLLFSARHKFLVEPSIRFLEKRIGTLTGRQNNES